MARATYSISLQNTLPFQIPIGLYNLVVYGPGAIKRMFKEAAERKKQEDEKRKREEEEEERLQKAEEERIKEKENRLLRRRTRAEKLPRKTDEELAAYTVSAVQGNSADDTFRSRPMATGGLWTDDDLVELVRLVKKYPGGTTNRWEIIGEMMGRTVYEVTQMAAKLKETAYKVPGHNESPAEQILQEASKKVKTRKPVDVQLQAAAAESVWSQQQQQALETAIIKFPKSGAFDRWQKIADTVPGKNKDECLARYKYLVDLVKKQKAATEPASDATTTTVESPNEDLPATTRDDASTRTQSKKPANKTETVAVEEKEVDERQQKSKKKKKGRKVSEDDDFEEEEAPLEGKGKAKNKRKERKKNIEYSYEDYEDSSNEDYDD